MKGQEKRRKRRRVRAKGRLVLAIFMVLTIGLSGCGKGGGQEVESAEPLGTRIATEQKSERDGALYPMTYQITAIDRDQDSVAKRVEEYNQSAKGTKIEFSPKEGIEYVIAEYKAEYPKDFPDDEFGITAVAITFSIAGLDGSETIKFDQAEYTGLSKTWELGDAPMGYDFYGGDTYEGAIIYMVPTGCKDYLIKETPDGKVFHYIKGE
ncbi:MAG: hypothetical protein RR626_01225 [Anaerovoracaceae bacterium]